jgi:hypothetical protein
VDRVEDEIVPLEAAQLLRWQSRQDLDDEVVGEVGSRVVPLRPNGHHVKSIFN